MSGIVNDVINVEALTRNMLEEAAMALGRVNVLIAGGTGVGKSTLVNAVFGKDLARTGQGRPVSSDVTWYTQPDLPYALIDTRGLEKADFAATQRAVIGEITRAAQDADPFKHVHVAWLCIVESLRRVEQAEIDLAAALAKHNVPVIVVITQARQDVTAVNGEPKSFQDEVRRLVPAATAVVRVRAVETQDDEGNISRAMGLDRLVTATNGAIPEGTRNAFAAAQRVDMAMKATRAALIVHAAAAAALAIGFTPIPFSDAALLVPVQVTMLAKVSIVFGLSVDQAFLRTVVASSFSAVGGTLAGRALVTALLKLVPGAGWIVGGTISGATAAAMTEAFGQAYVAVLKKLMADGANANPTAELVAQTLLKYLREKGVAASTAPTGAATAAAE